MLWLSLWSVGTAFIIHQAVNAWRDVFRGPSPISSFFSALVMTTFATPFTAGLFVGLFLLGHALLLAASVALAAGGVLAYVFYHLLKAPTALGAHTMEQIEGFKLFLETAEKDRLEVLNPPNVTPAMFESFLPYAIALDCENQWSKKFEAQAAAAGMGRSELWLHACLVLRKFLLAPGNCGLCVGHRLVIGQRRGFGRDRARLQFRERRRRFFRRRWRRWWWRRLVIKQGTYCHGPPECGPPR